MKQIIILASICCVISLCSCESKMIKGALQSVQLRMEYESYQEACRDNDFEAAHKFMEQIYKEFENVWESNYNGMHYDNNNRSKIETAASKYSNAASFVLCAEARFLISNAGDEATERITYLFNEGVVMGEKVKGVGYYPEGVKSRQEACVKLNCYKQTAKYKNELCDVVLNLAIANHNEKLAKLALSYYMQTWEQNDTFLGDNVSWVNDALNAAQKRYDEAVASGVFDE